MIRTKIKRLLQNLIEICQAVWEINAAGGHRDTTSSTSVHFLQYREHIILSGFAGNTALLLCCFMWKRPVENFDNASPHRRATGTGRLEVGRYRHTQSVPVHIPL